MRWLCSLTAAVALAQTPTGTMRGLVQDRSRSAVPNAKIAASNIDTGAQRVTVSDPAGQYVLPGLPIGFWKLSAVAEGFAPVETQPLQVSVGQIVVHSFEMQLAGVVEKMEVTETAGSVDVEASSASVALGYERIEEAPARSRNYLNFVLSAPSVAPAAGSSAQRTMTGVRSPVPDTGFTFAGMRPRNNSIRIDGMDNRDETTGGNRVAIGLEMVQEFRISGVSVSAEMGGAAGGLLNMVTRSGVNLWHGDITGFVQNEAFNANRGEVDVERKARFRRYQPGASGMGPLRRDRTFIAAAVEGEWEHAEEFANVPAVVPAVARGFYPTSTRGAEWSAKLDHQIGASDTVAARYAFSRGRVLHEVQGPDNFADRSAQGSSLTTDHSLVGSWMRVMGPAMLNDLRVQFGQRSMDLWPNSRGPLMEVPGVVSFGQHYRLDGERRERHYEIVESFHFSAGSHRFDTGADVHGVGLDSSLRERFAGVFVFPSLGDLHAGRPDVFVQAFGNPETSMRTAPVGLWLHDWWQLRRGLTAEFGVRYEHQTLPPALPASSHNWAPRFGLSWTPRAATPLVIRAGAGLFFDRYPLAWLKQALRGYEQYAYGTDAVRAFTASRTVPVAGLPRYEYHVAPLTSAYSRKISAGVEYGLTKDTSLSLEASDIRGLHLPRVRLYWLEAAAESAYRGLTITLNRRMAREFAALVSYSIGRARDNGSDFDEHPMNPSDARADWGPSRHDQRQRLSASAIFELPIEGVEWLEGISVAPIFTLGSGRPLNALLTTDAYRALAYPISARPAGMPRNAFLTAPSVNLDVRVMKTVRVMEGRAVLQFGVESFNLLNHTNPERVSAWYGLPTFGQTIESLPARQIQFLAQFEF